MLGKIIEKYPSHLSHIQISHKNFYEIATNFTNIMLKNNKNDSILNYLIDKLKLDKKPNGWKEQKKNNSFIEGLKDNNQIRFISPIKIKNETFSANEMNCVLDTLFYFKKPGNIIAHMNIEPKESIKLKKNVPNISHFKEIDDNIDIFDSNHNSNKIINGINNNSNIDGINKIKNVIQINSNNENIAKTN